MAHKKLKLLYIAQYLKEQTDEDHTVTVKDIIAHLESLGISAERKAVYDDLELLEFFGLDIVRTKDKTFNLHLGSRTFELPELKLLVDVVQASPFLTKKKSLQLIGKLETLVSRHQAASLRRQVYVMNRIKTANEQLYYDIDSINEAVNTGRKITFRYFDWSVEGERSYRRSGGRYVVNPVALCVDRFYYLVAYDEERGYVNYRVDRISDLSVSEEPRDPLPQGFDLAEYVRGIFDMYRGESVMVTVEASERLLNVIMDRFGREAHVRRGEEGRIIFSASVELSPTFLSWVLGFGRDMRILAPKAAQEAARTLCLEALSQYSPEA